MPQSACGSIVRPCGSHKKVRDKLKLIGIHKSIGAILLAMVLGLTVGCWIGAWGVWKSTDKGATFSHVLSGASLNGVFATPTTLYASYGWSSDAPIDPGLRHASLNNDAQWTKDPTPSGMTYGPKRVAVVFDGAHQIAIGGFYLAGVWRYTEN